MLPLSFQNSIMCDIESHLGVASLEPEPKALDFGDKNLERILVIEKETERILTSISKKEESIPSRTDVQGSMTAASTAHVRSSDLKSSNTGDNAFGGISEDLLIEAKKRDKDNGIKKTTNGDTKEIGDDDEKDNEDPRKKKHDFDFLSDILVLLFRLGVIKNRMEKKHG